MTAPESTENLAYHLRRMADAQSDQIDADRLSRAADVVEYTHADLHDATTAQLTKAVEALQEIVNTGGLFGAAMGKTGVDIKIRTVLAEIKKGGEA